MAKINFSSTRACRVFIPCAGLILAACATQSLPPSDAVSANQAPAPIFNFHVVDPGKLYRGGQPVTTDYEYLKKIGIRTVVKLNQYSKDMNEKEEIAAANRNGIELIEKYMPPEDFPHNLNPWAAPTEGQIKDVMSILENSNKWPIFVHCSHGQDRTGEVVAIWRVRDNNYCKTKASNEMDFYGASKWLFRTKAVLFSNDLLEKSDCVK